MMKKIICLLSLLGVMMWVNAQVIFEENFDSCAVDGTSGIGQLPTGWAVYEDNLTTATEYAIFGDSWSVYNAANVGKVAVSVSWTAQGNMDASVMCNRWLISPKIVIPSADMDLTFMLGGHSTQMPETLKVMISTTTKDTVEFEELERFNNVSDFEERRVDLSAYEGEEVYIAFVNCGNGYYVMLDEVRIAVSEALMMHLVEPHIPYYTLRSSDVKIGGRMQNKGMEIINEFDAYYEVDGDVSEVTHFSGLNIAYGEMYDFEIAEGLSCVEIGEKEIEVWITNVNGDATVALYDNHLKGYTIVYDALHESQKTVLMEHFTTAECPNCPAINQRIEEAILGRTDVVRLIHHAGYYEDEMTVEENEEMLTFYNKEGKTYAPAIMLDRSRMDYVNPGPVFAVESVEEIGAKLDEAVNQPALVSVEVSMVRYDEENRALTIGVSGNVASELEDNSKLRLSVYLMEDSVWGPQMGAGDMYHMNVMRDAITDVWGDELNEMDFNRIYTYNVPMEYDIAHCKVVAFVSLYSDDINQRNVVNACQSEHYLNVPQVGIRDGEEVALRVYPNPVVGEVVIEASAMIREVEMVNAVGQRVLYLNSVGSQQLGLNVEGLNAGMYVVRVKSDNGMALRKVVVVK